MPEKTGLEILPIREQRATLTFGAALILLIGGIAGLRELIDTGALIYYLILFIVLIGGLWYVEKYWWRAIPPHKASCWEIGFLEGHWAIQRLDTTRAFWISRGCCLLQIDARSGPHLGEPEIVYVWGPDRDLVRRHQEVVDGHVAGLLEAAQRDLHGRNRGLLGPAGAIGLVRYTITEEGRVYVATRQLIGFQNRVTEHGELLDILQRAGR